MSDHVSEKFSNCVKLGAFSVILLVVSVILFGFIIPFLISATSNILVILGFFLVIVYLFGSTWLTRCFIYPKFFKVFNK